MRYRKTVILAVMMMLANTLSAQLGDLGIVWKKNDYTDKESLFRTITPQPDGTYLAAGTIIINDVTHGYVVHFSEGGETIRQYIIPMANAISTQIGDPVPSIARARFLDDGSIIAVGKIGNYTAGAEMIPGYPGYLLYGAWFTKIDVATGTLLINRLDRGSAYTDITYNGLDNTKVITYGADIWLSAPGTNMGDIGLLRVYDKDGNVLHDNQTLNDTDRLKGNGLGTADIQSDGSIIIKNNVGVFGVSSTTYKSTNTYKPPVASCGPTTIPPGTYPWPRRENISILKSGNFLLSIPPVHFSGVPTNVPNRYYGWVMTKFSSSGTELDCQMIEPLSKEFPSSSAYSDVKPAPGSDSEYMGTYTDMSLVNRMYKYTDSGTFPNIEIGPAYPFNTKLSSPSITDGFFSCGQDLSTKRASIAKLSTCSNFKVTTLPNDMVILKPYNPSINISIPIEFTGAKGKVEYFLKAVVKSGNVNGKTAGEELKTQTGDVGKLPGGQGLAFNLSETYQLNTEYAVIEYTLVLNDSYETASVQQSCGQTYVFQVKTVPETDVVAMPLLQKGGTVNKVLTTIKNIGQGSFENYKITIYENTFANTKKHIYTHPSHIRIGETVRFDIDLTGTAVANASKVVVSLNDDGSGNQGQAEVENKQLLYEVE